MAQASLTRFCLGGALAAEFFPHRLVGLRAETLLGWQLYSGTVIVNNVPLSGTDPNGLRFEAKAGAGVQLGLGIWAWAQGGLALDGLYTKIDTTQGEPHTTNVTNPSGLLQLSLDWRF